jgi:hypothetical protein
MSNPLKLNEDAPAFSYTPEELFHDHVHRSASTQNTHRPR